MAPFCTRNASGITGTGASCVPSLPSNFAVRIDFSKLGAGEMA
jgi:hypothetical protein